MREENAHRINHLHPFQFKAMNAFNYVVKDACTKTVGNGKTLS